MLKTTKPTKTLSSQAGVTLLELLVVLIILSSITAAIAIPMAKRAPSQAQQMADLKSVLSEAQWQARQTQTMVSIQQNKAKNAPHRLPSSARFAGAQDRSIRYFPDGSARGPNLVIDDQEFGIDMVTGGLYAQ